MIIVCPSYLCHAMTMAEEIDSIYMRLKLFSDICEFLDNEANKEVLSPNAKKQAELLIKRSKKQISFLEFECKTGGYMPMGHKLSVTEEVPEYSKSTVSTEKSVSSNEELRPIYTDNEYNFICPDVQARNLPNDEKNGYLAWKIKLFFGLERVQKIYAALYGHYLLIYRSDKDSKPTHTYNLHDHDASPINRQDNNETRFLLTNIKTKSTNQFIAQTHKDMVQWVVKINRCSQRKKIEPIRDSVEETSSQTDDGSIYNEIIVEKQPQPALNKEESEEEEIYEEPEEQRPRPPIAAHIPAKPPTQVYPIPNRMQRTPLPAVPDEENSFSDEPADDIYDQIPFTTAKDIHVKEPPIVENLVTPSRKPVMRKPSNLKKPKIDVKIITHSPYGNYSTKKIMKIAQESSLKN